MNVYQMDNAFGFPKTYLLDSASHNQAIGNKNFLKLTYFIFVADFNETPLNLLDWKQITVVGVHKRGGMGVGRVHRDTKSRPAFSWWTQVFSKYNSFAFFSKLIKRRRIVNFSVNVSRNRNKNLEVRSGGIRGRGVRRRRGGHRTRTSRTRARITRTRGTRTWWSRRWRRGNGDVLPPDYIQVRHKLIIIITA